MQIEIPPDCGVVRDLMLALERGLVIQPLKPSPIVHNCREATPQLAPVKKPETPNTAVIEIAEPGSIRTTRRRECASRYRGSLYIPDMLDRQQFYYSRRSRSPREYLL